MLDSITKVATDNLLLWIVEMMLLGFFIGIMLGEFEYWRPVRLFKLSEDYKVLYFQYKWDNGFGIDVKK
jgi:uncharacterized membrane protein (UPF0182 family)